MTPNQLSRTSQDFAVEFIITLYMFLDFQEEDRKFRVFPTLLTTELFLESMPISIVPQTGIVYKLFGGS